MSDIITQNLQNEVMDPCFIRGYKSTKKISFVTALVEKNNWTRLGPIDPIDPISKTSLKPIY